MPAEPIFPNELAGALASDLAGAQTLNPAFSAEGRPSKGRLTMLSTALRKGGGAEEQVMQLSLGLHARGWRVNIVSLISPETRFPDLDAAQIPVSSLGMTRGIPDPRAMLRLTRELRKFRPHVVHCHMPQANLLARAVRPFHAIPVVINTLHALTMEKVNGSSGRSLEIAHGLTDRFSDLTTVICGRALHYYVESGAVRAGKISVMHNGVNTAAYQPDPSARQRMRQHLNLETENGNPFVWLAAGRFTLAKAYPDMIRAYAQVLRDASRRSVLLLCGEGPLDSEIRSLVRECGIESQVRFLGLRKDIPQLMNAADAFVMSSRLEGLPLVLLEASSTGLPIVTTSAGGNAEIVLDGETGFVVPPENPASLAAAMLRMMNLPASARAAMAQAGRNFTAERFDMKNILDRWERLYAQLMARTSATQR